MTQAPEDGPRGAKARTWRRRRRRLPRLVSYLLRTAAIGAGIGVGLAVSLVATDTAGLRGLVLGTSDPIAPMLLLIMGCGTLFGGIYTGAAIMLLPRKAEDDAWLELRDDVGRWG